MSTERLIRALAADAARPLVPLRPLLWATLAAGAAGALALFMLLLGPRSNLPGLLLESNFRMKLAFTLSLALGAALCLDAVARPLMPRAALRKLVLAPLLLLAAVLGELATAPSSSWLALMVGRNAAMCCVAIPVLSALPAGLLLVALKHGAPARPPVAGAVAGLAAGGLGATLYATFCPVDSPLFVATWYPVGIGVVTAICALAGRRWLRW